MLLVAYDISDDRLRTRFSKMLSRYGYRLQYSIFEIKNSRRILDNITVEISTDFEPEFQQTDSIIIFRFSKQCKITRFGYAGNDDEELLILW